MANLGEYGSLLQLGFGVGAGLTVFRGPVDLRMTRFMKAVDEELSVLQSSMTAEGRTRFATLCAIKLELVQRRNDLERWLTVCLAATLVGAVVNWGLLVCASIAAQRPLSGSEECALIFVSVIYYCVILVALEILARWKLHDVRKQLRGAGVIG